MRKVMRERPVEALLDETEEEVERLVVSTLNDFFDKVVVPRYGRMTADGVTLGPTWWAERTAMTPDAVRKRVSRRRSEPESERTAERDHRRERVKAVLRNPDAAEELLDDPEVEEALEEALERKKQRLADHRDSTERLRAQHPEMEHIAQRSEHAQALHQIAQAADRLRDAVQTIKGVEMSAPEREMLADELESVEVPLSFLKSFAAADGSLGQEIATYLESI